MPTNSNRGRGSPEKLVPDVRPTRPTAQAEVLVHQLPEIEVVGESGGQEEPRVGDKTVIVEGHIDSIEAVR